MYQILGEKAHDVHWTQNLSLFKFQIFQINFYLISRIEVLVCVYLEFEYWIQLLDNFVRYFDDILIPSHMGRCKVFPSIELICHGSFVKYVFNFLVHLCSELCIGTFYRIIYHLCFSYLNLKNLKAGGNVEKFPCWWIIDYDLIINKKQSY